jgi:peptidoglycan hydrolase-like protein with peptidoglycan-binding domain
VALLQSFGINLPGSTFPTANNSDSSLATCPDLQLGTISSCVRLLQIKLNTLGYIIAITGPGRPGGETNIFGPLTQVALARYQREHQISPALGYFGPLTRSYLSSQ